MWVGWAEWSFHQAPLWAGRQHIRIANSDIGASIEHLGLKPFPDRFPLEKLPVFDMSRIKKAARRSGVRCLLISSFDLELDLFFFPHMVLTEWGLLSKASPGKRSWGTGLQVSLLYA